jgi:hypothetical protein
MTGPNSIHTTGLVQRLLQHVNAISPAERKRDKQVPLPPFSAKDPNLEASRAVSGIQRSHDLLYRGCSTGREVDVLGRTLHKAVRLDRISAGDRQPKPGTDGQYRVHQGLVVTVKHGRPITPVPVPGSVPAIFREVAAADAAYSSRRRAGLRSAIWCSAPA